MNHVMHLSFEQLVNYVEGRLRGREKAAVEEHLSTGCRRCNDEVAWIEQLLGVMKTDRLVDPPKEVVERACRLYREVCPERHLSDLRLLEAALIYDSRTSAAPVGVRMGEDEARQLLYRAEGVDIDIQVRECERPRSIAIRGQLLPRAGEVGDLAFLSVRLMSGEKEISSTFTNAVGEFAFEAVETGAYGIGLGLKNGHLHIRGISL